MVELLYCHPKLSHNGVMDISQITVLAASVSSLVGAFVLWRKSRPESQKTQAESNKIAAEEFKIEVELVRETYSKMLNDQLVAVVDPMKNRIDGLEKKVAELNEQVNSLKRFRSLFEISVRYIRELCHWIDTIEHTSVGKPKLPVELRSYFEEQDHGKN